MCRKKSKAENTIETRLIENIDDYIKYRLDDQINWYDNKAASAQRWYKGYQVAELIIAALIPLLSGYVASSTLIAVIIGVGGALISLIEGICKLFRFHENWIEYRSTCELLRHGKYLYEMRAFPYCKEESYEQMFVKNVESLISAESSKWKTNNVTQVGEEKKNQSATGS